MTRQTAVYLDMDNTLAVFSISKEHEAQQLERMYEKGFFRNLPVLGNPRPVIEQLQAEGYEVYILTKCIESAYCIKEKWQWLQEHTPSIDLEHFIPVPANCKKTDYVVAEFHVLADDYSKNCDEWEMFGGVPVKFQPKDNGKEYDWDVIRSLDELPAIVRRVESEW